MDDPHGGLGHSDLGAVARRLSEQARLLAQWVDAGLDADRRGAATGRPADATGIGRRSVDAVRVAGELKALADTAVRLTVQRAGVAGHSWQEIGDLLGIGPLAAFERYGRTVDQEDPPATAPVIADAADRAIEVLVGWFEGRDAEVAATFDATMTEKLPADRLAAARSQLTGTAGRYRRLGDEKPLVRQRGDYTVADVPLVFEAGTMKGRVAFDRAGRVAGLYVLPPATP